MKKFFLSAALAAICACAGAQRFGIVTDVHYADKAVNARRYYSESKEKLKEAVDHFNGCKLDFVIELGDLKDCSDNSKETTLGYLDGIESILSTSKAPVYHCLGNHDMDRISKKDFLSHISNPGNANGRSRYSFVKKGVRFIVLDANFRPDGVPYECGNYSWKKAFIPEDEMEWLRKELWSSRQPVVVFIHQMLDSFDKSVPAVSFVTNADEVRKVLTESRKVIACFQGHWHEGSISYADGIHYFTQKGMIMGKSPESNSFSVVEIDRKRNIKVTGMKDCQSAEMKVRTDRKDSL